MPLLHIITAAHTHIIMDIHRMDIMDIPDIMATETIHIMGIDLTVIRAANTAAEYLHRFHVPVSTTRFLASPSGFSALL
jgi:hypothetical protein